MPLPLLFMRLSFSTGSVDFFQRHAALALPRLVEGGVAETGAAAVAEEDAGPFEADALDLLAATALAVVRRVDGTFAVTAAGAEERLVPFDLDHVISNHRLAAGTVAGLGTDGIALALGTAVADIKQIVTLRHLVGRHRRRHGHAVHLAVGALHPLPLFAVHAATAAHQHRDSQQQHPVPTLSPAWHQHSPSFTRG